MPGDSGTTRDLSPRLFDAVAAPVLLLDENGHLTYANRAAQQVLPRTPLAGTPLDELFSLPAGSSFLAAASAPGGVTSRWQSDGAERTFRWEATHLPGSERTFFVCTGLELTEQEQVRHQLHLLEQQVQAVASNVPSIIWAVDRDLNFTIAEGRGLQLLGLDGSRVLGHHPATVFAGYPEIVRYIERAAQGETFSVLVEVREHIFEAYFEPVRNEHGGVEGVAGVATDVTERRRQEMSLAQAQKMESLGVMAGSVAHDFNNLLTAILGFAGLLKLSNALDPRDREQLYHIEQAARRGADLAGRLLSFSRGGLARFVTVDLCEVVQETARLVSPTLPDGISLVLDLPARPVHVEGDDGQLQQAVLNIVLNARDALGETGVIQVHLTGEDGQARLHISDDGPGMDESTRARIFEPFFTTKQAGSGTGLGLAITYGIVRGHKGQITLDSVLGGGTSFQLVFPLLSNERQPVAPEADAGEGNLVLLVDDDELVRRSTSATLSNLGYNVVEVGNGSLAVELVNARPGRFAAVLLDLVMPGMTGREVFHALSAVRPDLPVVVCTGYAADAHIDDEMKRAIAGLLQKPFSPERLLEILLSVGARPSRRAPVQIA